MSEEEILLGRQIAAGMLPEALKATLEKLRVDPQFLQKVKQGCAPLYVAALEYAVDCAN